MAAPEPEPEAAPMQLAQAQAQPQTQPEQRYAEREAASQQLTAISSCPKAPRSVDPRYSGSTLGLSVRYSASNTVIREWRHMRRRCSATNYFLPSRSKRARIPDLFASAM